MANNNSLNINSVHPLTPARGGTGISSLTTYTLLAGGTTSTGNLQQVSAGTSGQLLQSNGASALPSWTTAAFPSGSGTLNHMLRSDGTNWVQTTSTTLDASDNFAGITSAAIGNLSLSVNTLTSTNTNGNIYFQPNGVGNTVVTNVSTPSSAFLGTFGVVMASASATQAITSYTANTGQSSQLYLAKSHSTVPGSFSAIGSSEVIGQLFAFGDDGTQFSQAAAIRFFSAGSISSGVVPGQIQFLTTTTAGIPVQAMAIAPDQQVSLANNLIMNGTIKGATAIANLSAQNFLTFATGGGTPVNYFEISNTPTGSGAYISSKGADTNIGMNLLMKGTGLVDILSTNTVPLIFQTGTAYQRTSQFTFADIAGNFAYTFPDATGTIVLAGANSDIASLTGITGVIQAPTFINGSVGNHMLGFVYDNTAVNYINVFNSATATRPGIQLAGTDTDIGFELVLKNAGDLLIDSTKTLQQLKFAFGPSINRLSAFTFASTNTSSPGCVYTFPDASGTLCMDTSSSGSITTAPPVSSASTLALGTAYKNTAGYDIVLTIYIQVTAATTASIALGVGSTNTPTQQTIISGLTVAAVNIIPVTIYLPNNYYALLSTSGTITASISGQIAMPV